MDEEDCLFDYPGNESV